MIRAIEDVLDFDKPNQPFTTTPFRTQSKNKKGSSATGNDTDDELSWVLSITKGP